MRLLSRLALRAGLAAVTGLVEELVLSTAGILRTGKHTTHLEGQTENVINDTLMTLSKCENKHVTGRAASSASDQPTKWELKGHYVVL